MNYLDQLNWRYATKEFDTNRVIPSELWQKIEQSLILTPSSFGLQPWKFVVITDQKLKDQLRQHSWGQAQVSDCSHFIVFCAQENLSNEDIVRLLDCTVNSRGGSRDELSGYQGLMEGFIGRMNEAEKLAWAKNQVYIALGQLMATAAALEIDACPLEGISPADFDTTLELSGYKTVVACALGYRSSEDKYAELAKIRYSADEIISHRS